MRSQGLSGPGGYWFAADLIGKLTQLPLFPWGVSIVPVKPGASHTQLFSLQSSLAAPAGLPVGQRRVTRRQAEEALFEVSRSPSRSPERIPVHVVAESPREEQGGRLAGTRGRTDGGAEPDDLRRLELLIGRGEAERRAGDPGYRQTLLDAAHLAEVVGDANALARAALANTLGYMWTAFSVDTDRIEVLESAIAAVGGQDAALRARLLATLGLELAWQPDPTRRVALSQEALQIARVLDDAATLAHVLLARDYTITDPENVAERFDATSELLAFAELLGDPVVASRALSLRFKVAIELADVAEAERSLARNEALVADLGQSDLTFFVLHHRASLAVLRGEPDTESRLSAADELGRTIATGMMSSPEIFSWARLFWLRIEQGRIDEISGFVHAFAGRPDAPSFARAVFAHTRLEEGDPEVAAGALGDFVATGFTHPRHTLAWLMFMVECAWSTARLGRKDCVPPLRSALEPYAGQLMIGGFAGWIGGSVSLYLAMLATTAGDYQQADADFAAAAATHERIGAPIWLARTRLEWARMLLARAQPSDPERAADLLNQALSVARELGLTKLERDAGELLPS